MRANWRGLCACVFSSVVVVADDPDELELMDDE